MTSQSTQQGEPAEKPVSFTPAEVSTNAGRIPAPNHRRRFWQQITGLVLSILVLAAGIALLILDRTTIFATLPCQASDLTCPAWWEAPAFDIGIFAWVVGGMATDGVSGRPYGRWLIRAVALLSMYLLVALITQSGWRTCPEYIPLSGPLHTGSPMPGLGSRGCVRFVSIVQLPSACPTICFLWVTRDVLAGVLACGETANQLRDSLLPLFGGGLGLDRRAGARRKRILT